jgi:hypothetical protein
MDVKPLVALARKDTNFVGSNPTTNSSYINKYYEKNYRRN